MRPVFKKTLWWSGLGLVGILLLVFALASWLLFTTSGARWAAGLVTSRFATQVSYATLDGTLASELRLTDFRFTGPPDAAQIRIEELSVEPTLMMLLSRTLRIENARVRGLLVTLPEQVAPEDPNKPDTGMWVEPPLDIVVDDFALLDGRIVRGAEKLFALKQLNVAARWSRQELRIDRLSLLPGDIEGNLDVKGRVTPAGKLVRGELDIQWSRVVIPENYAGRVLHTQGAVHFDGTPEAYTLTGELDAGPPGDPTHAVLDIKGTDTRADIRKLELVQKAGQLALDGHVEFEPVAWQLRAKAREFNPGALLSGWDGNVNLDANTQGVMQAAGPSGSLQLLKLDGNLRGRPIAGEGNIEFAAPSRLAGDLRLSSGKSRIAMTGNATDGNAVDATIKLAVASLADWVPRTGGSLNGDFRVRGKWPALEIAGTADGKNLSFAENRAATLRLEADVRSPLQPDGELRIRASKVAAAGYEFQQIDVDASGSQAKHEVVVSARSEQLNAAIEVNGGLGQGQVLSWRGQIAKLTLKTPDVAELRLREPTAVEYDGGDFSIGQTCLVQEAASLCVQASLEKAGPIQAAYSFERVPLNLANALAPTALPGQLRGELQGEGKVRRDASGQWFGDANITSASATMLMEEDAAEAAALTKTVAEKLGSNSLLLYENLTLQAALEGARATVDLTAGLQSNGNLRATLNVTQITSAAPKLDGRINVSMPTLAPFGAFVPTVANLNGTLDAQILVGGTMAAPEITGNIDAQRLQADLGKLGIELRDGRVRGEARAGGGFTLAASVASGKGHLELAGTLDEHGEIKAQVEGQNFQAADIPAANVTVTPNLQLTGNRKGYLLRGELTVPRADINLQKLPQDKSRNASPDVVVIRNGKEVQPASTASALPLTAVVTVKLGQNIKITGYGLESTVSGELVVREAPGVPTTGSGQLLVAGTYKAYGQDLTIKDGRLLFAGSPLDNPRLAIVAMREINSDLSTGLRIAGSARQPIITVISDPNVGEADALSYLVTGRSLNDVGSASGSSQDTLASATRSLEGAGAGLVAKRLGARLGLDEATVEENAMIGGSALTIGEYLSPRLYLSYGVGLFEPGEVIALRYKLSDDVGVHVQRGTEETRAGIEYRIEK